MQTPKALLVMPKQSQAAFQQAASGVKLQWTFVETCEAAEAALERSPDLAVVATDVTLSDGNWYCVLSCMLRQACEAPFYVIVPEHCDSAAILEHGVSGVLHRPLDSSIVAETLEEAVAEHARTE